MKLELTNQFPEIATELCQSVINLITDAVIAIDHQGIITLINPATEKIFGFGAAELIGQNISILMPSPFQEQHDGYIENYHRTGEKKVIGIGRELFGQKKDGSIFPMKLTVNDLTIKEHKLFIGIIRDISDKVELRELNQAKTELEENYSQAQEIQAQVVASLREKEILIKEIHHRVKNNLQLINSLLNLRLRRDNNLTAEEVINEIKNRIQAISLIHEMLYQEKDKAHLDLKSYFTQLINYLILSHSQSKQVNYQISIEEISISIDQCITCGLIAAEILTNSLKHAFSDTPKPEILFSIKKTSNTNIAIIIRDNGKGIDLSKIEKNNTLGLDLVKKMAQKIDAKTNFVNNHGTTFTLEFPI